jgi:hypothetical protein
MYDEFTKYIKKVNEQNLSNTDFKSNPSFTYVQEHMNLRQGAEYLRSIETEFPEVTYDDLKKYVNLNDRHGNSKRNIFTTKQHKMLYCSPTNMRYVYHALLILKYFKESGCSSIVEIGANYGGLFLAINNFAEKYGVEIKKYNIVELTDVCTLIKNYLELNKDGVHIPYELFDANTYGENINDENMFVVSNYCFTELVEFQRTGYVNNLLSKVEHGFLIWQTCFGLGLNVVESTLKKTNLIKEEEKPQTAPAEVPNFFIRF